MYKINDTQIDFILEDLSARGLEMVSLQQDLLDHICCMIENKLEENGNFEEFYQKTITTFYKDHLWEIEEETIRLLINKNYYAMKKIMIYSGAATTFFLSFGLIFKFMHWPGASIMLVLGIFLACLIFLPLMFKLRVQEKDKLSDKIVLGLGSLCGALMSFHVLFKVLHWPYANLLGTVTMVIFIGVFIPIYFFSGIKNPDNKVNTIVSTVLIVLGCSLVLILMRSPKVTHLQNVRNTAGYLRSQQLLSELKQAPMRDTTQQGQELKEMVEQINGACELLKEKIIEYEIGSKQLEADFEDKNQYISDTNLKDFFNNNTAANETLLKLNEYIIRYNQLCKSVYQKESDMLPYSNAILDLKEEHSLISLYTLQNIQLFLAQK